MRLKFWQSEPEIEQRSAPYADAIVAALVANAVGDQAATAARTGVREAVAGLWARSFASATVTPSTPATRALTPVVMELIGRQLYEHGEIVFEIAVMGGRVRLIPAASWEVLGHDPVRWQYRLQIATPEAEITRYRDGESVVHLRYGSDTERPWESDGPAGRSTASGDLNATLETRLRQELGMPVGAVIPVPDVKGTGGLQADLAALKGNTVMVPSAAGGWDEPGQEQYGRSDWRVQRLGGNPPQVLAQLRVDVADQVASAGGVPPALFRGDAEGTAKRESWRLFLHSTCQPVAKIITEELREKLDEPELKLSFDGLFASDLSGRARAFQSMVGGGMDVSQAAGLAGLMEGE